MYTQLKSVVTWGDDSWNVDITDAVADFLASDNAVHFNGKVPLSIRCDNTRDAEMIPSDLSDFNLYGGIYRYLNLVYLPPVSVASLKIEPHLDKNLKRANLKINTYFYNPADVRTVEISWSVKDANGTVVLSGKQANVTPLGSLCLTNATLNNPMIWDVQNPQLYVCEVTIRANGQEITACEKFGFRTFEFIEKGPFHLNGRRLLLRGTHRHEDHAGVAAAMTEEQMVQEMNMMKEMGVNFIRLGHYQQSEIILNLCDQLGILVWEEIPWCRGGVGGEQYRAQAKRMLTCMIEQHRNHPAVIIWGLGNENDWPNDFDTFQKGKIRALMSELHQLSHQLDDTRLTAIRRCDFCSDLVDVYSPSIWAGWYRGNYTDYREMSQSEMAKVSHFLHVEWGGDSHAGRHAESAPPIRKSDENVADTSLNGSAQVLKKGDWSETYIVNLIDWHLKEQENMSWLTGTAYWPFKDFSTPIRPENPVPYVNQKGVVERDFTKKESYFVFQSYWAVQPMIHIYGHSRPVRWGEVDEEKEILVYSNCSKVELFVNGVNQGLRIRDSQDFPGAGLRWNVKFNAGKNTIKAIVLGKDIADELTFEYQTDKWGKEVHLQLSATSYSENIEEISVQLVDEKGIRCLDFQKVINFEIAGDGKLIQNQGTAIGAKRVQAYNGRALIRVQRGEGESVVAVKTDGIPTAFITIRK